MDHKTKQDLLKDYINCTIPVNGRKHPATKPYYKVRDNNSRIVNDLTCFSNILLIYQLYFYDSLWKGNEYCISANLDADVEKYQNAKR